MARWKTGLLTLGLVMGAPALAQGGDARAEAEARGATQAPPRAAQVEAAKPGEEALVNLHQVGRLNVDIARLGLDKGRSAEVRDLAEQMLDRYEALDLRLMTLAANENVPVGNPIVSGRSRQLIERAMHHYTTLSGLSGEMFDQAFMQSVAWSSAELTSMISQLEGRIESPDVRAYLAQVRPQLEELNQSAEIEATRAARRGPSQR